MDQLISATNIQVLNQETITVKTPEKTSLLKKFITWCDVQEGNKYLWLGVALFGNIGAMLPITLFAIYLSGNDLYLWIVACAANVPVLALHLAAQPVKITLPTMFVAWLIDAAIILYCLSLFFLQ